MDFENELRELKPDIFFVNEDGYTPDKQKLCKELGIELKVSKRLPYPGLPARSTTTICNECLIPFRLDLAGGWLDQPFVSKYYPGPVITISIEPTIEFNDRCGMATSTRVKAINLWQTDIPEGDKEKLAHTLFCVENPPGTKYVSGSQDSIGIVFPGVNKLNYSKENYCPASFESLTDEATLSWIEEHLWFINLSPRDQCFDVLSGTKIDKAGAKALADAAEGLWQSILDKNPLRFGKYFRESFEAQIAMFPNMVTPQITEAIHQYETKALGWKISGAGGGGYLVLVSETPVGNAMQVRIRR